jgi:nitroreductase
MPDEIPFGEDAPLLSVMATMRAMRRLKPDPVPRDLLTKLVEAATLAPSGGNEQGYEFIVVDDRSVIASLAPLWARSVDAYVAVSREPMLERMDRGKAERLLKAIEYQRDHFAETPALIVPCYKLRQSRSSGARLVTSFGVADGARLAARAVRLQALGEGSSIYPGVQNLLLTARALGLGANITIWHLFLEHEWKRVLGVPKDVGTFAVIPIGWPLGRFGPVARRPAAEAIHWDRW